MSDTAQAMSCQEFVEVVTDYLEQQMTQARQRWTDEHLAGCDACQAYLEQMRQTIHTLRGLAEESTSDEQMSRAVEAFRAEHAAPH